MDPQSLFPRLRDWFEDYVTQFSSDDPIVQENVDLKAKHTRRVCKAIIDIGASLDLSKEDLRIAEASALLHDVGRFEQYSRYGTFSDYRSEDHAALGVKIIQAKRVLEGLEPAAAEILVRVVGYHNRAVLPVGEGERCLLSGRKSTLNKSAMPFPRKSRRYERSMSGLALIWRGTLPLAQYQPRNRQIGLPRGTGGDG